MRRVAVAVALVLAGLIPVALAGCSEAAKDVPDATVIAIADRQPGPAVAGTLLDGTTTWDLAQHKGDVVVINFWGSWCGPCVAEAAAFEQTYAAVKAKGVTFVGVNVHDQRPAAQEFATARLTYPSIFDPAGKVALGYAIQPLTPTTFIVDRQGRLAFVARRSLTRDDLEPAVTALAAEST